MKKKCLSFEFPISTKNYKSQTNYFMHKRKVICNFHSDFAHWYIARIFDVLHINDMIW